MTDEAGIIAHARLLASELGPGDPAATLLALAEQNARLQAERDALGAWACVTCGAQFAEHIPAPLLVGVTQCSRCVEVEVLSAQNAKLAAEGDTLWAVAENQARKVIRLRRVALRLRDAWRAAKYEAAARAAAER